jgi:hypothetical protein
MKKQKLLHWSPRILCILAILYVSIFAVDAFDPGLSISQQLKAFALHQIPSFILLFSLIIAWKWELIGGIIFTIIGLGLTPIIFIMNYQKNNSIWMSLVIILTITLPFIVVGVLFIINHFVSKDSSV